MSQPAIERVSESEREWVSGSASSIRKKHVKKYRNKMEVWRTGGGGVHGRGGAIFPSSCTTTTRERTQRGATREEERGVRGAREGVVKEGEKTNGRQGGSEREGTERGDTERGERAAIPTRLKITMHTIDEAYQLGVTGYEG